jgi:hypothetical protein
MTVRDIGSLSERNPLWDWVVARPRLFGYLSLLAVPIIAVALLAGPLGTPGRWPQRWSPSSRP